MSKRRRWLAGAGVVAATLLLYGFVIFAGGATREPAAELEAADGIVVLTGGQARIGKAARLLLEGRAGRMLISGVNRKVSRDDILRLTGLSAEKFECCVDIGYTAHDTVGNADETREWAERRGYNRLIIVTASYHMPRSLAELGRVLPGVKFIPYPVVPKSFHADRWWLHPGTTRILISEYAKFLPSAARFVAVRMLRTSEVDPIAVAGERLRSRT